MWLDTLCLLPFLIQEIDRLFVKHPLAGKSHLVLVTFLIWFTNFYTGYMALLFGALYLFSRMVINWSKSDAKFIWRAFGRYLSASIIASFLCLNNRCCCCNCRAAAYRGADTDKGRNF